MKSNFNRVYWENNISSKLSRDEYIKKYLEIYENIIIDF